MRAVVIYSLPRLAPLRAPRAPVSLAPCVSSVLWSSLITVAVRTAVHPGESQNPCPTILDCPLEVVLSAERWNRTATRVRCHFPQLPLHVPFPLPWCRAFTQVSGGCRPHAACWLSSTTAGCLFDVVALYDFFFFLYDFLLSDSSTKGLSDVNWSARRHRPGCV